MRYDVAMSVSALSPSPSSTRPYLIRALYEWCTDNGYTPYIAAYVDDTVQVPREHVKNNEIVLNISMDATSALKLGNEFVEFKARFSGSAREIMVPIDRVIAIYARENGQGMAFPVPQGMLQRGEVTEPEARMHAIDTSLADDSAGDSTQPGVASVTTGPRVVQLVSTSAEHVDEDDSTPPEPPAHPPAGPRPSLKRVK
jgi:stringent starvation protein B